MEAKERYELLNKLLEEIKSEQKYPFPIDCVMQTGNENGQFSFTITGRICFDNQATSKNPMIPDILDTGQVEFVNAELRDIYNSLFESLLDRIAGVGCERIMAKQKPKETLFQGKEYKVYGTSQVPPKTILVSYGDELWRNNNVKPKA